MMAHLKKYGWLWMLYGGNNKQSFLPTIDNKE